jgi:hypothetical protein
VLGLCIVTAIAITGVGLLMFLGNIQQQDSKQAKQKYISTDPNAGLDTATGDPVARGDLNKITLFDVMTFGGNRVFGQVRSDLSRPVERIGVQASFYNPAGQLIAVKTFWMADGSSEYLPPLFPNSSAAFQGVMDFMPQRCSCRFEVIEARYVRGAER